jgi:hypothetical protein
MKYDLNELEADGVLTIYRLDDGMVVAQYEELEIYKIIETHKELLEKYSCVLEKLQKFESGYFVCPDCEYKVSPDEFLTGGKKYEEESWPKEEDYL